MLLWRKDGSVLTHVSNDKHSHLIPAAFESSSQEILIRLQDVNVVVLNQTRIRQPSDSSSVRWDEPCIMYAAQFNVPWVRVPAIARARCILCLPTMQFLHIYTCLLNDPVRSKRKVYRDYRNWRWQFYSHNPIPWVVQLISINRIWNLVIGEGFHSANKIQLCKNRWNLNAELQTWDTGGEQAARWKLGFCGIMMRNQSKSVTKKKFRQNPSSHDSSPSLSLYVFWIWQKASGNILQCVWFHLSGCIWAGLVTAVV